MPGCLALQCSRLQCQKSCFDFSLQWLDFNHSASLDVCIVRWSTWSSKHWQKWVVQYRWSRLRARTLPNNFIFSLKKLSVTAVTRGTGLAFTELTLNHYWSKEPVNVFRLSNDKQETEEIQPDSISILSSEPSLKPVGGLCVEWGRIRTYLSS